MTLLISTLRLATTDVPVFIRSEWMHCDSSQGWREQPIAVVFLHICAKQFDCCLSAPGNHTQNCQIERDVQMPQSNKYNVSGLDLTHTKLQVKFNSSIKRFTYQQFWVVFPRVWSALGVGGRRDSALENEICNNNKTHKLSSINQAMDFETESQNCGNLILILDVSH